LRNLAASAWEPAGELENVWVDGAGLPAGTRIWLVAGITDMRGGFNGLAAKVQTVLEEGPFSGHVLVFRGRRGDIVKLLW